MTRVSKITQPVPNPRMAINAIWLMKLRWVAVVGQLTTVGVVAFGLQISVRLAPLLVAVMVTTLTNLVYTIWLRRVTSRPNSAETSIRNMGESPYAVAFLK